MVFSTKNKTYDVMSDEEFQKLLDKATLDIQKEVQEYITNLLLRNNYVYVSKPVLELDGLKMQYHTATTLEEMKIKIDTCNFKGTLYSFENLFDRNIKVTIGAK